MSAKTGRPPTGETTKNKGYRLRMTDGDVEKLEYCCEVFGLTKAEVIRAGINMAYNEAQKINKK